MWINASFRLVFTVCLQDKLKTHLEHMALPPPSDVIIYLFLIIYVKENMIE